MCEAEARAGLAFSPASCSLGGMKSLLLPGLCCLLPLSLFADLKPAAPKTEERDVVIGPDYVEAPEMKRGEKVPAGEIKEFTMKSADSKVYPGLTGPYERKVWVYVPKQYAKGKPVPFMIVQDGGGYVKRLTPVMDNLIHDHKLPVMAAVFINSGGGDGKGSERGLEYDAVSEKYTTFIESEVLPRAAEEAKVVFTKDPEGRASMGGSSGAACAFTMGWFRPDLYRRILSYSGTYVAQESPDNPASPHGAWEYHENFIPKTEAKPLRIWLQVGDHDNGWNKPEASYHNWVMANDRMAAVLKAKNYQYRYVMCKGAGHVDGKAVGQTLPGAMLWLWEGYPVKGFPAR